MYEKLKEIIETSQNIVFFGGAGVSTESNIPDFRSEAGLYNAIQKYKYPPEKMLSRSFFDRHTETFFDYYKNNMLYKDAKPNKAHLALAKLEEMGKLKAVITQNIDGLHQLAGSKTVYELHGSIHRNYCMNCRASYDLDTIIEAEGVPKCNQCKGGIIKPDVVLYEEALNDRTMTKAIESISKADTLIIGGTSLAVYPAAGLIHYFHGKNLVLINKDKTPYDSKADLVINDPIGEVLGSVIL